MTGVVGHSDDDAHRLVFPNPQGVCVHELLQHALAFNEHVHLLSWFRSAFELGCTCVKTAGSTSARKKDSTLKRPRPSVPIAS